jgi:hypothetical protein
LLVGEEVRERRAGEDPALDEDGAELASVRLRLVERVLELRLRQETALDEELPELRARGVGRIHDPIIDPNRVTGRTAIE